ncbi:membrane-associated guanylate kinase, WW and PDZ domain-containing protein 1 isoform X2 [Frankliniella occidentalis]|uniref:Membrane-associated guanylate kinase, WW and PDZ domain-containing protein 1 isoform X2 n=1 Tax=Frankliniella occidentalis TaxID=133901 RepID=A0A6J1S9J0_FRAOC|nr:membrane-associated guanylate kinase, WW and PDZ domain-containing protein 1 isoform X2 [Frankliniella occidentalis]
MQRSGQKRPNTPSVSKCQTDASHWAQEVREVVVRAKVDGTVNFAVRGGSDHGEFAFVVEAEEGSGLFDGDLLLEVQGEKVAGYTQRDVEAWLSHCCRNGNPVTLKSVRGGAVPKDLRVFLNTRFQRGSVDHDLQNTIRDNLYLRTVPVTTRPPREGEVNGVDYTFLSLEEFAKLERSGSLLESGIYEGNHYGTPKPSKELQNGSAPSNSVNLNAAGIFPGAHPSSEGKRRRNRSNVEAMAAKSTEPESEPDPTHPDSQHYKHNNHNNNQSVQHSEFNESKMNGSGSYPDAPPSYNDGPNHGNHTSGDDIGPLPPNWEKAYTERGEVYFIDHNSGTSHWLDPRLSKFQKKSLEECTENELPYGWEKIHDPHYGTYYIDHVNRRTQYENPVIQAKRAANDAGTPESLIQELGSDGQYPVPRDGQYPVPRDGQYPIPRDGQYPIPRDGQYSVPPPPHSAQSNLPLGPPHSASHGSIHVQTNPNGSNAGSVPSTPSKRQNNCSSRAFFTRNPLELEGERIQTTLIKSARGLGFTIVGGDDLEEEFLQIKSVVPNGSAWLDGKLQTGDVLVYVNDTCVLGFTHHDMVSMFQSIAPGETVSLEVCRGYPLPFDPNDPNTEVVTTVAVNAPDPLNPGGGQYMYHNGDMKSDRGYHFMENDDLTGSSVKSMPELCDRIDQGPAIPRPNSTDTLLDPPVPAKPEFLTISIVKGAMGFGFTIADSAYGQKVKKILDRQRCKTLQEGDILVEINNVNVRTMCHGDVVQVLKDCPRNVDATITVQRGSSSNKNKVRKKEDLLLSGGRKAYRSKTPTADLYSTQPKEVVPTRPKTPLVDTRTRSKTPTNVGSWMHNDHSLKADSDIDKNTDILQSPSIASQYDGFPATAFPYPHPHSYDLSQRLANTSLRSPDEYSRSHSPGNELDVSGQHQSHYPPSNQLYFNGYGSYEHGYGYGYDAQTVSGYAPHPNLDYYPKGKESTSFEHEQPLSSLVSRYPRDPRWIGLGPARVYPAEPGFDWVETLVTLQRQETGFGFRIVGGTEEGSQVSIGHIVPGGAADLDGRLCTGDEMMSVDGQSVINTSHHHVVQLMARAAAAGRVTLGIRRRIPSHDVQSFSSRHDGGYPYDVTVTRRENEGFGFVIISSVNKVGSTIGRIIEGSPAERCNQLHVGDRILAVNHMNITSLHHGDIVNLIKDSGYSVTLTIGAPLDDASSTASVSHREEGAEDEQYHAVELNRGTRGFGFSIRGGREFQNMPLFVLQIAENGPASLDNRLKVGDQIIEINGINTKNMTHAEAIEIIRNGGPSVRLLIKRGGRVPPPPTLGGCHDAYSEEMVGSLMETTCSQLTTPHSNSVNDSIANSIDDHTLQSRNSQCSDQMPESLTDPLSDPLTAPLAIPVLNEANGQVHDPMLDIMPSQFC